MYEDLKEGLTQAIDLERQVSELEDVAASLQCQLEIMRDDICRILFEGENTEIGRIVTLDRIKEYIKYYGWLEEEDFCIDYCEATSCDNCAYKDAPPVEKKKALESIKNKITF